MKWTIILFLAFSISLSGATLNSDGSASDTQTKVTSAASGDTVLLPGSGSYTWTSSVTIPSSKYITLDGNGRTVTLDGGTLTLDPHATGNSRITGFNFAGTGGSGGTIDINDTASSACYRFDHCTFAVTSGNLNALMNLEGRGQGLIDHFDVSNINSSKEFIHINGWHATVTTGWTTAVSPGTSNLTYIEDCTFTANTANSNASWIQGFYGCRVVIRHNTFDYVSVDMHGTPGNVGARWWECYSNTFTNASGDSQGWAFNMRAGSGVIYSNATVGVVAVSIGLCEEDSGYPADYQIGRGINQTLDPAYIWANTGGMNVLPDQCDAPEVVGMVQLDRDYYESAKPGYSGFTYPHPLQGQAESGIAAKVQLAGSASFGGKVN